jgi:hypothetical protein
MVVLVIADARIVYTCKDSYIFCCDQSKPQHSLNKIRVFSNISSVLHTHFYHTRGVLVRCCGKKRINYHYGHAI